MMHDNGIHEIDMPPLADGDEGGRELELPAPVNTAAVAADASPSDTGITQVLWSSKRLKIFSIVFAVVGALAVGLAVASHNLTSGDSTSDTKGVNGPNGVNRDSTAESASIAASPLGYAPPSPPTAFLSLELSPDSVAQFVVAKKHWNSSFLVYPMIEKHSGPPRAGLERGTILLDTTDYVFHFDQTTDGESLLFVSENHRARLASGNDDLKPIFDAGHWPGYYLELPITRETEDALYVEAHALFSSGFFVADTLATSLYKLDVNGSEFYPRNAVVRAEYILESGIAVVSIAIGLLPKNVMPQRIADDRVGYFSSRYTLYGADRSGVAAVSPAADATNPNNDGFHFMDPMVTVLNRRRLELDPATNRTKEPIIYYIDPSVPKRWRSAFVAGVLAWKPAFEAIGFPDAVRAIVPDDADWPADYRLGDLRYDSISVMISDETYALGPSVIDPRSGEILHSDITFEYGFFNEVVADFDRDSPVDPPRTHVRHRSVREPSRRGDPKPAKRLRQCGIAQLDHHRTDYMLLAMVAGTDAFVSDEIVGQHFTDIVMHEVGHTLGLRHNFAGSSMVTRKELSDAMYVAKHGLSTSIMDYVPVNIFSDLTPVKAKTHEFYMTTIGVYDMAAIAYGYAVVPDEVPGAKCASLTALARAAPFFLTDEDADVTANPFGQRFDLSNDPVDYAADRLRLAKQLRDTSLLRKVPDDTSWTVLWRREAALLRMINNSVDLLAPVFGGVNVSHAHRVHNETKYSPAYVPRAQQLRALSVLSRVIASERGIFPAPADYSTYIQVRGIDGEDCREPSLEYYCLARGLVDLDSVILGIQRRAIYRALFPTMARIVSQDVNAPVKLPELLASLRNATSLSMAKSVSDSTSGSRAKVLRAYLVDTLQEVVDDTFADVRVTEAIMSVFPSITSSRAGSRSDA